MSDNIYPIRPDADEQRRAAREAFINRKRQSLGSVGPFRLLINGRYRTFEFHGVCGPVLLNEQGDPLTRQPSPSSEFWKAFEAWRVAGCHVDQHQRAYVPSRRILGE